MCGAPCGCGKNLRTTSTLLFGLVLSTLLMPLLCLFASVSFLTGGHGHSLICTTLYQSHYKMLGALLNDNGVFYENSGGFLKEFLQLNESLRIEDVLK